jgi:apurinic endonuclease APN1
MWPLFSPNAEVLAKSQLCLLAELERCGQLGVTHYNFHPGSTCNLITKEACMDLIASSLNAAHKATSHLNGGRGVVTVLECMAGQGGVVGSTFEELAYIVTRIDDKTRVGVCVDTCHAFAAGIDLRTEADVTNMLAHLDATVGLKYLRGFHFNDSKGELNCRKDRHESIGQGCIGSAGFRALMNHPALDGLPLILETPCPDLTQQRAKYANEIAFLYAMESEAVPENREGRPLPYNPPSKEQLDEKKEVRKKMLEQKRNDKKKKKKKAVEEEEEEVEEDEDEVEEEDEDDKPLVRAASSSKESKPKLKRSQSAPSTAAAATAAAVDRNGSKKKKAKVTKRDVVPEEDEDEQDDAFMEDNDGGEEAAAPVPTPALKRGKSAVPAAAAAAGNGKLKKAHSKAT